MKVKGIIISLFLALGTIPAAAQFYSAGQDPGYLKWNQMTTANYRVIYPRGLDSLASVFARDLEAVRLPVSKSIGFVPNEYYRQPLRVVLHPYTAEANGSVGTTPFQMDLYTVPNAGNPLPLAWDLDLVTHESRHAAQMQFGRHRGYKVGNYIIGDLFSGAIAAIYGSTVFFEGDAVTAETALSSSGRGRSADFLEFIRMSFDSGDMRDWYRWRYGSQGYYTPDFYRVGYMTVAGARAAFDDPLFTKRFYENVFRKRFWHFPLFNLQYTLRQDTGQNFRGSFTLISDYFKKDWDANTEARGKLDTCFRRLTPVSRGFTEYKGLEASDNGQLFAVRSGIYQSPQLVSVSTDGTVKELRQFGNYVGKIGYCGSAGKVFWSECIPDPRWSLKKTSRIRYYDLKSGRTGDLTRKGKLYNPSAKPDGKALAVTNYPVNGGSSIDILDICSGESLISLKAPDSLQFVESVWIGERLFASGISKSGSGLYELTEDRIDCILQPQPHTIKQLSSEDGKIYFTNDANGVNEIFSIDINSMAIRQITNTRYGSTNAAIIGNDIYFGTLSPSGRGIYTACLDSLGTRPGDLDFDSGYKIADILCSQEAALTGRPDTDTTISTSVRPYSKLGHLFRIHAWAPLYVEYDNIKSMSFESLSSVAALGAVAFFQNDLGTMSGDIGFDFGGINGFYQPAGHIHMTYSGLYPVLEGRLDINEGKAYRYWLEAVPGDDAYLLENYAAKTDEIGLSGSIRAYIPFNFSSGGWNRGLVPQVSYAFSNSVFNSNIAIMGKWPELFGKKVSYLDLTYPGEIHFLHRMSASVRGYSTLSVPSSCIYPKLGIGAEIGYSMRPGLDKVLNSSIYGQIYGYLPGIAQSHGIRLSAIAQWGFGGLLPDPYASVTPRGLNTSPDACNFLYKYFPAQAKFSIDYAMPVLPVNWDGLGPVAYVRNFELIPHADFAYMGKSSRFDDGTLMSLGGSLSVRLGNFLWIPYTTRIGVDYSYNCGSLISTLDTCGSAPRKHSVSLMMSVDF